MSEFKVASRYAKALLDLAKEMQKVDTFKSDMDAIADLLKANTELKAVLANPIVPIKKKMDVLLAIFDGRVEPIIVDFLKLMVKKGRASLLLAITKEFGIQYNEYEHIIIADVVSAVALSDKVKSTLSSQIAEAYNGKVKLNTAIDSSLIGGFILQIGDQRIDASVSGKLNRLSRSFQLS
ncbi:ATP synthase F1 subunit delta [Olivibacter sitiensis]|uniref:ATP synthase F1 subunit delta n=1 Tax=Olivibacter sitiensis TaxID=376470 RepID=UPI000422E1D4|nr:ATP synthase F1 subunit delta [Olivibacter sitiensis]